MANKNSNITLKDILKEFESLYNPVNIEGMKRYGINLPNMYGISMPVLRTMAKRTGKNTPLALELWDTQIHDGRILASLVAHPADMTEEVMEKWVADFQSWDICDQVCCNLFWKTGFARQKVFEWSSRPEEFVKRAAFVVMLKLIQPKNNPDADDIKKYFEIMLREASDERNFVKKGVNWALRQAGKSDPDLYRLSVEYAQKILKKYPDSKSAAWVAKNALNELNSPAVQARIELMKGK